MAVDFFQWLDRLEKTKQPSNEKRIVKSEVLNTYIWTHSTYIRTHVVGVRSFQDILRSTLR